MGLMSYKTLIEHTLVEILRHQNARTLFTPSATARNSIPLILIVLESRIVYVFSLGPTKDFVEHRSLLPLTTYTPAAGTYRKSIMIPPTRNSIPSKLLGFGGNGSSVSLTNTSL